MTNDTKLKNKPWEDTLILAFRDMQWIKKIQNPEYTKRQELAKPPALMIKLDGNAETAAGDILAGINQRFFLFEFKSAPTGFKSEEKKQVHQRLVNAGSEDNYDEELLELSRRGHFLVYPQPKGADNKSCESFALLHRLDLWCAPYCYLVELKQYPKSFRESGDPRQMLESIFYDQSHGLDVDEISHYLQLLADQAEEEGGNDELPLKAVIASPNGLFWPAGSLSAFKEFVQSIEQYAFELRSQKQRAAQRSNRITKPSSDSSLGL